MPQLDKLKELFLKEANMPLEDLTLLLAHWNVEKKVDKKQLLCEKGRIGSHLFFVHSGTFKIYYLHKGEEICVGFGYPNTVVCAYPSFIRNEPSEYYIEAITSSELTGIDRKDFYKLLDTNRAIEKCWRILTEEALLGKIQRELEILTFTPEERYVKMLNRSPHVFQLIPQKYLASYLGITPETFSRIKRKYLGMKSA